MTNGAEWRTGEAPAAIILAGGEGKHDDERTRRRAARLVLAERTLFCVTRAHERFYGPALADIAQGAAAFEPARARMVTPWEDTAVRSGCASLASVDFAKDVLERCPEMLAVLPVHGVGWRDLGEPKRVAATQRELQWQPAPA